jgi:hypothetical protein
VWDELVRELSKSFYVINNIERESRIINVSFLSNSPSEFADCGKTMRTYVQGEKIEHFDYATAASATFKFASPRQRHPAWADYAIVRRETNLEGRVNIYVAPDVKDADVTTISVNARYMLTIKTEGTQFSEGAGGQTISLGPLPARTTVITFNTNKGTSQQIDQGNSISCFGTGKLEADILSMVR